MGVRIVTDTGCDLPTGLEQEVRELGVKIVPFLFHFGHETFRDKMMPMQEFVSRAERTWPTTAVPSSEAFAQAFRECVDAGQRVLCITVTSKHSSTYNAATLASQAFAPGQVTVLDSMSLSLGEGILVLSAARAAQAGKSLEHIIDLVKDLRRRLHVFITLDTVRFLVKGGRASRLNGAIASVLRIRPILTIIEGELTLLESPRGRKVAKRRLIELAKSCFPAEVAGVGHIVAECEAKELTAELATETGTTAEELWFAETGMVLATHGGPGTLGTMVVSMSPQESPNG
jgi:DegV family protein with EDD domain